MSSTIDTKTRFVYHRVPVNLTGSILYPLNQLKHIHLDVAINQFMKYHGRQALLKLRIPRLNCLWNDVLHFSPVHPAKIKAAMEEAGLKIGPHKWKFFEIDTALLSPSNTIIWEYREHHHSPFIMNKSECIPFEPHLLEKYTEIGEWTRRYYKEVKPGTRVLPYVGIAHVLYKGQLNVEDVTIIDV